MRAVVQRVSEASVQVAGEVVGQIGPGLAVLVGVKQDDTEADARYLADKTAHLRVFADAEGRMNLSLRETAGGVLVVSQFTLYGDIRRGRRPSYAAAAAPDLAEALGAPLVTRDGRLARASGHQATIEVYGSS